jgi:hypothetical protein
MKYLLLIHSAAAREEYDRLDEDQRNAITEEYFALTRVPGVLGSAQLQRAETATTVRVQDGRTLTTDGPFMESKEELGGFYLYEADDLDAALDLAARIPAARMGGAIEVRPLVER